MRTCEEWHWRIPKSGMDRHLRLIGVVLLLSLTLILSLWEIIAGPDYFASSNLILSNSTSNCRMVLLNSSDYTQLMDLNNFSFKILNTPCNDSYTLVVILVHSAPENFEKRQTIRQTWGQRMEGMKLLFMLGLVKDPGTQRRLVKENKKYRDFVQGTFLDCYRNITYKHAMVFKYALYYCPQVKYLLKTDDDVFINTYNLLSLLNGLNGIRNLLICQQTESLTVIRSNYSKWRVSYEEYKNEYYPPYCPGWSLLYSIDLVFKLYKELQTVNFFWIDDVLITGIIFKKLNMTHLNPDSIALSPIDQYEVLYKKKSLSWSDFLFGDVHIRQSEIRSLWKIVTKDFKAYNQIIQTSI